MVDQKWVIIIARKNRPIREIWTEGTWKQVFDDCVELAIKLNITGKKILARRCYH